MKSVKLPKQWKHWAMMARLSKPKWAHDGMNLVGRNRNWRINCHGDFECSCPLERFDRWANSRGARMDGIPKTKSEFLACVSRLVEESKDAQ